MRRIAATTLGLLALATFTAACGDDSSSADTAAPAADTTVVEETVVDETVAVEETVVEETVAVDETSGGAAGDGTEFCALYDSLSTRGETAMSSDSTPEELNAFFANELPDIFAQLAELAPDEIAADLATSAEGFDLLADRLAANEWDITATMTDPATAELMSEQQYSDANAAIDEFCGV